MVAAAKMHSHNNLVPSPLLSLDTQFLFVDEVGQPRLIKEAVSGDVQFRWIRSFCVERPFQIVFLQNLVHDHTEIALLGNRMTILTIE